MCDATDCSYLFIIYYLLAAFESDVVQCRVVHNNTFYNVNECAVIYCHRMAANIKLYIKYLLAVADGSECRKCLLGRGSRQRNSRPSRRCHFPHPTTRSCCCKWTRRWWWWSVHHLTSSSSEEEENKSLLAIADVIIQSNMNHKYAYLFAAVLSVTLGAFHWTTRRRKETRKPGPRLASSQVNLRLTVPSLSQISWTNSINQYLMYK